MGSKPPPCRRSTDRIVQSRMQRGMHRLPPTTPSFYELRYQLVSHPHIGTSTSYGLLRTSTRTFGPLRFCPHLRLISRELARAYQSAVQSKGLACSRFEQLLRLRLTTRHAPCLRACNPLLSVPLANGNLDCGRYGHGLLEYLSNSCLLSFVRSTTHFMPNAATCVCKQLRSTMRNSVTHDMTLVLLPASGSLALINHRDTNEREKAG
ncbi:hypothetical protein J3F83DRAFT_435785 [Trichoderma novae-zelandiae]